MKYLLAGRFTPLEVYILLVAAFCVGLQWPR